MKKNNIIVITLIVINFFLGLFLTIFTFPSQIPIFYDFSEKITTLASKWIMLFECILPAIFGILSITCKDKKLSFFSKLCFILTLFENSLFYIYFSLGKNLTVGSLYEIPTSVSLFMPLSVIITVVSLKMKNIPYLDKPALQFKTVRETEFIWKQTHYFARNIYFPMGVCLFFVSAIFSLFRLFFVELAIFVTTIFGCTLAIYLYSKSIYEKYLDMKKRKDNLDKNKNNPPETKNDNSKSINDACETKNDVTQKP